MKSSQLLPTDVIENKILPIRGQKVQPDRDLAQMYGVETKLLNKAVSRNISRFPNDFMFRLSKNEFQTMMFHFGPSSLGGMRKFPRVFTKQGVAMLYGVLRSQQAMQVNIQIMRVFAALRKLLSSNRQLSKKTVDLETKISEHDENIIAIFEVIKQLIELPQKYKRKIGFIIEDEIGKN